MSKTLLLIDDSAVVHKVIEIAFSRKDLKIEAFSTSKMAQLKAVSTMPDIILIDISMPDIDGYDLCRFFRSKNELAHTPIILLAEAYEDYDEVKAKNYGATDIIKKPFEVDSLVVKVESLLQTKTKPSNPLPPLPHPEMVKPQVPPPPKTQPSASTANELEQLFSVPDLSIRMTEQETAESSLPPLPRFEESLKDDIPSIDSFSLDQFLATDAGSPAFPEGDVFAVKPTIPLPPLPSSHSTSTYPMPPPPLPSSHSTSKSLMPPPPLSSSNTNTVPQMPPPPLPSSHATSTPQMSPFPEQIRTEQRQEANLQMNSEVIESIRDQLRTELKTLIPLSVENQVLELMKQPPWETNTAIKEHLNQQVAHQLSGWLPEKVQEYLNERMDQQIRTHIEQHLDKTMASLLSKAIDSAMFPIMEEQLPRLVSEYLQTKLKEVVQKEMSIVLPLQLTNQLKEQLPSLVNNSVGEITIKELPKTIKQNEEQLKRILTEMIGQRMDDLTKEMVPTIAKVVISEEIKRLTEEHLSL